MTPRETLGPSAAFAANIVTDTPASAVKEEGVACPRCDRGEVFGMSTDDGFWVEMGSVAGGANEHGMNGWLELIEHHPDGHEVRREYVAKDSPLQLQPSQQAGPHCQLCGGNVEGWTCQTCEAEFEEVAGLLVLKSEKPSQQAGAEGLRDAVDNLSDEVRAYSPEENDGRDLADQYIGEFLTAKDARAILSALTP